MTLRRLLAAFLFLALGASALEAGIADVHDGDATHAELQRFAGAVAHADLPAQPDEPLTSGHAQHACHCAHTHYSCGVARDSVWSSLIVVSGIPNGTAGVPSSTVLSPRLRPPIA